MRALKKFLCNDHWRVLVLEGNDCNLVVVDVYKRGARGQPIIQGPPDLLSERLEGAEVQAIMGEAIFVKFCVEKVGRPEEYFLKARELLGLEAPQPVCVEEEP
ncbi:hypothetical protein Igni_1424 [Ignicoccus hospitalis KIN4/I]|uniref:Uncharacterized protein n=1 Tax=Ignicoccus hospitalis (strain KIN4/I / DSM 18386 / JCM 14125) TaxID=453591 RepID=A8ACE8_IGNH4|nr:hypothetical protein Igni_1424 [Ignicoccus hospitalis KIN4/I]